MMCFVSYVDDNDCVVIERMGIGDIDYISTPIGKPPPLYCDKCDELFNVKLNK
jgi:hypothetical protein